MKVKAFFQITSIFLLTLFCLTSCKKKLEELFSSPSYVTCKLNGEKYAAHYRGVFDILEPTPDFYYNFRKREGYFRFNFSCYPKKDNSTYRGFSIELCLFLDSPLSIEDEYTVAVLPDFHQEDIHEAIDYYKEKRQSYCVIETAPSDFPFCFGNGVVTFKQINNPNETYMGKFGFTFTPDSAPQRNDEKEMNLQGEFLITNTNRVSIEI